MYDEFKNLSLDYSSKENILNEGLAINKKTNKFGMSDYRLTDINSMPINFAVKEQQIPFIITYHQKVLLKFVVH